MRDRTITITKKLRPIRLAFLVDKEDKKTLREVFRINTCRWGGIYNPIIPFYKRTPRNWEDRRFSKTSAASILRGYLDSFDPDYLVLKDKQELPDSMFDKDRLLSFEEVLNIEDDYPVAYGLDIIDLYRHLYDKEFKFERRHPIKIFRPKPAREIALLSACFFGEFPTSRRMRYVKESYSHCLDPQELTINKNNILNCFVNDGASPLRITKAELQAFPRGWEADPSIFFMDATSWLDIIDYWNLRAVGRDVLPLPKQYADHYIDLCNEIIKRNFVPYRQNEKMMHRTNFICSRSSTTKEMMAFSNRLTSSEQGAISLQRWYPRMWDEWARDADHVERCSVTAKEESEEALLDGYYLRFKDVSPEFADKDWGNGRPRWVNIIRLKDFHKRYECPSVLPRNLKDARRIFGLGSVHTAWISSEGINLACEDYERSHFFEIPTNLKVFEAWFREQHFDVDLSDPGKILGKIIDSVGGLRGVGTVKKEEISTSLNEMSHAGIEVTIEESVEVKVKPKV